MANIAKLAVAGSFGAALAALLSYFFAGYQSAMLAATALGAFIGAGVWLGRISPRLAGAAIGATIGALLGIGVDDTSGLFGIPVALIGAALCGTRTGLALMIVGEFVGIATLVVVIQFASVTIGSLTTGATNFLELFCCVSGPIVGALLGNRRERRHQHRDINS